MSFRSLFLVTAGCAGILLFAGCGPRPVDEFMARVDDLGELDELHDEIEFTSPDEWVESYVPKLSSAGYNLVLYLRRVPMLIDMQGNIVHSWPGVRCVGRARLDTQGRLAVIGTDDLVKEYDWDGNLTWAYRLPNPGDLPHHDLIKLANGNYLVLSRGTDPETEVLHEVDRKGRVVWEWRSIDHLVAAFPDHDLSIPDSTHINSLFELGENRWIDEGDRRFKPGNLLLSARNLNAIFIIDKKSGDVVWVFDDDLDNQHEAQMVPKGLRGEGLIVFFNNGYQNLKSYRRSEIRVIDPIDGSVVWNYFDPTFFSSVAGTQQILANGNLMVSSSEGGRVFEITPEKEKVWEWIPPYLPMRVLRYPADHCPQLSALGPMDMHAVTRKNRQPWVDIELGRFGISNEWDARDLFGKRRQVLRITEGCRELLLPPNPVMHVCYGFEDVEPAAAPATAAFKVTLETRDEDEARMLVDEVISSTGAEIYQDRYFHLSGLGLSRVEVCIAIETEEPRVGGVSPTVFMSNPRTFSRERVKLTEAWDQKRRSEQEKSLEERQLKALGYVQ